MFIKLNKRGQSLRGWKRAQSTLEYGVLITVVVGGLLAMAVYMKRGIQGKLRESTDSIGEQYSPELATSTYTSTTTTTTSEELLSGVTTTTISGDTRTRTGSESIEVLESETW